MEKKNVLTSGAVKKEGGIEEARGRGGESEGKTTEGEKGLGS